MVEADKTRDPIFFIKDGLVNGTEPQGSDVTLLNGWYFWDETSIDVHGPFGTRDEASMALKNYGASL